MYCLRKCGVMVVEVENGLQMFVFEGGFSKHYFLLRPSSPVVVGSLCGFLLRLERHLDVLDEIKTYSIILAELAASSESPDHDLLRI